MQCEQVGIAGMMLGGGREKKEDSIDPAVGLVLHKKVGERVVRGEPLCTVHYNSETRVEAARKLVEASYRIADQPASSVRPLVHGLICGTENEGS
jgi:thymidine phosphorylase